MSDITPVPVDKFEAIELELVAIKAELDFIRETIVKADTTITTVANQVMPTIEELMKSPLLKMLGMKK